jgi:hypothetical protein
VNVEDLGLLVFVCSTKEEFLREERINQMREAFWKLIDRFSIANRHNEINTE